MWFLAAILCQSIWYRAPIELKVSPGCTVYALFTCWLAALMLITCQG